MAKSIWDGFKSKSPQQQQMFKALQQLSMAEELGQPIPAGVAQILENSLAIGKVPNKTTPRILPIDENGNPLSLEQAQKILATNADDIASLATKLAYIEDPNGFLWGSISKLQTGVAGSPGEGDDPVDSGLYGILKQKIKKERVVLAHADTTDPTVLAGIAVEIIKDSISKKDLPPVNYAINGTMFGVDFTITGIPELKDNFKIFATVKAEVSLAASPSSNIKEINIFPVEVQGFKAVVATKGALQIEHTLSDAYMPAEIYYKQAVKFKNDVLVFLNKIRQDSNTSAQDKKIADKIETNINKAIAAMDENLKAFQLVSRMIGEEMVNATSEELLQFYKGLVKQGKTVGLHIVYRDKVTNALAYKEITLSATLTIILNNPKGYFFGGRQRLNGAKGNVEKYFKDKFPKLWWERASPSSFTSMMMAELARIFGEKVDKAFLKKNTARDSVTYVEIAKVVKAPKFAKTKHLNNVQVRKPKNSSIKPVNKKFAKPISPNQNKSRIDLLAIINRELKQAVLESMVYPALINRTGTFASSVKVLGLTEEKNNLIVDFIYKKSPYSVFSNTRGISPWNSVAQRDPTLIITNAIEKIRAQEAIHISKQLVMRER